jgi:hypothetical protein
MGTQFSVAFGDVLPNVIGFVRVDAGSRLYDAFGQVFA